MRAKRQRPLGQQAAAEARRSDGLTAEQHKALMTEFDRRISNFKESWRACRDGRCRRGRQCLGPRLVCNSGNSPWTNQQYRRLKRDIIRKPPRVQAAPRSA
jgi:hypothetical protein